MGIVCVAALAAWATGVPAGDAIHLQADQLRCQGGEAVRLACRPTVLNGDSLALYPAEVVQPLLECLIIRRWVGA
jgi:hypothetical protein